jgi:hypothetical protein
MEEEDTKKRMKKRREYASERKPYDANNKMERKI